MCGIVGAIGASGRVSKTQLLEMRDTISHRGPDQAGFWQSMSGNVLLGSRRLAILDLSSSGHQPMHDEASGLTIVFNGEIYNYVEIAAELASAGFRFRSRSDTEVLLKSYLHWGESCLERLNGMFAFAIWDETGQQLFAARDRFGEKPFYFYHDANRELVVFGSEIKTLIQAKLFATRANLRHVCKFLANGGIDAGSATFYEGIFSLPAAHWLKFSPRSRWLKIGRYWDLNPQQEMRLPNDLAYAERLLDLLSDSVRLRLRSDVAVGSSLSGGLDSSTIVSLVAKQKPQAGQETFSARFPDPGFDEGTHIQRMTSWAGVKNRSVYPEPNDLPQEIGKLTWHQDAPFASSSIYAQWCVMRLARDHDVTVLLDGQGADEVLAGYHAYFSAHLVSLLKRFRFLRLCRDVCHYVAAHGSGQLPLIVVGLLPPGLRLWAKNHRRPLALQIDLPRDGALVRRHPTRFLDPLHQSLYETLTETSLPQLLRYADRNSMAFSREVRLPFLDHRLVEYLFSIPAQQKIAGSSTKQVLRNATRGVIPEEIRNRKDKVGFAPPEGVWLRGPLRPWVEDVFASRQFKQRGWADTVVLERLWRRFKNGDSTLQGIIWRWLSLETWARTCMSPIQIDEESVPIGVGARPSGAATIRA